MGVRPLDIIVRCMGYHTPRGVWVAKCIDFDLVAEGGSMQESRDILYAMIESYVSAVLDTEDKASIAPLLMRKAPWGDRLLFVAIKTFGGLARRLKHSLKFFRPTWSDFSAFEDALPMHLGRTCN